MGTTGLNTEVQTLTRYGISIYRDNFIARLLVHLLVPISAIVLKELSLSPQTQTIAALVLVFAMLYVSLSLSRTAAAVYLRAKLVVFSRARLLTSGEFIDHIFFWMCGVVKWITSLQTVIGLNILTVGLFLFALGQLGAMGLDIGFELIASFMWLYMSCQFALGVLLLRQAVLVKALSPGL